MNESVPAGQLYDIDSRTPIAHPAHQATDEDVRRAFEDREIRADGGHSSSGTDQLGIVGDVLDSKDQSVEQINHGYRNGEWNPHTPVLERNTGDETDDDEGTHYRYNDRLCVSKVLIGGHTTPFRSSCQKLSLYSKQEDVDSSWALHTGTDREDGFAMNRLVESDECERCSDRKYREELRALVESAEYAIESYADRMQHIMGLADHVAESSPFQERLAKNGADLEFDEQGDLRQMRIDTILSRLKSDSFENVATIASEALEK